MAIKPLTDEAIALTEKKMDMTLDDIIKMSNTSAAKSRKHRISNKSQRFPNGTQENRSLRMRQYMQSRSTVRQGVLAQRRSSFKRNGFPLANDAARKAAVAPYRAVDLDRVAYWNKARPAGPVRRQEKFSNAANAFKKQQQSLQTGVPVPKQKPKTLDSLFANMKEQRMRTITRINNGGTRRGGVVGNQRRQPWIRGRFGYFQH